MDDRTYARRVADLVGLLPPVDELKTFVADLALNKRVTLVDRLLEDNRLRRSLDELLNDHLRNAYFGPLHRQRPRTRPRTRPVQTCPMTNSSANW